MLKAFEQQVSDTLDALEDEGLVNPHEETENYDELADLVRGRIGNFHEWKASKRRLRGVGGGVKGLEIEMQDELPRGERIQGAFRLVSSPVDAARQIRTHFGDVATFNQYRVIQTALARSGLNHTDEVRSVIMQHFHDDATLSILEKNIFHIDNWTPID